MAKASGSVECSQVMNTVQSQIKAALHDEFGLLTTQLQRIADQLSRLGLVCPEESSSSCPQIAKTDAPSDTDGQQHSHIEIVVRSDEVEAQKFKTNRHASKGRQVDDFVSGVAPVEASSDESEGSIASVMCLHSKQFDKALAAMRGPNTGRASGSSDSNLRHGRASHRGSGKAGAKEEESPLGDCSPNNRNSSENLIGRPYTGPQMEVDAALQMDAAPPTDGPQTPPKPPQDVSTRPAFAENCSQKNGGGPEDQRYRADEMEGPQEDQALPKSSRENSKPSRENSSNDGNLPSHLPARLDSPRRRSSKQDDHGLRSSDANRLNVVPSSRELEPEPAYKVGSPSSMGDVRTKSGMASTLTLNSLLKRNANRIIHLKQDRSKQQQESGQSSDTLDIFTRSAQMARVKRQMAQADKKDYTEEVPIPNLPFFALVACGVVDCKNGLANRLYRKLIVLVVVAILVHEIMQHIDNHTHFSLALGRRLSRLMYAVCTLLSLLCTQASSIELILGPDRDMIGQYAMARGIVNEWRRRSLKWFAFAVGLCLTSVLLESLVAHGLLDGFADDNKSVLALESLEGLVLSGLHTMSLFLQLYICIALELFIDKFCEDFMTEENYSNAVDGWNLIDAILVQTCSAIAVSYLMVLSSVAASFIPAGLDVYTERVDLKSEQQLARWVIGVLTPLLLRSVLALVVLGKGASVSQKCATVPGFISSVLYNNSGEFPGSHQYLVTFVQQSGSGFYVLGARLTMFVIVKICWAIMMLSVFLAQSQLS